MRSRLVGSRGAIPLVAAGICVLPGPVGGQETATLADAAGRAEPPVRAERLSPAGVARRALPAVVEVVTYADGRKLGGGSGFLVGAEGLVATSHHVLEGAERVEVILHSGETYEVLHATAADDLRDLVILRIAGFGLPVVTLGDSRKVAVGDRIVVIGSPLGLAGTVSDGLISAKRELQGRHVLQISAPISNGSSGGPVFDLGGRVVGVLAGFMRKGQNVNFAVPAEHVRALLALPARAVPIDALARKSVSLLAERPEPRRTLSLHTVLPGESIEGEESMPWALQPRRVRPDRVRDDPAAAPEELAGLWEIRELTRMRDTRSGIHRGALISDGERLHGSFFGSRVSDRAHGAPFEPDRVRTFGGRMTRVGHLVLEGEHGCTYFLQASPRAMTGLYECALEDETYDLGAVEARRIAGVAFSGRYRVAERIELGGSSYERSGDAYVYALSDGRWLAQVALEEARGRRVVPLREGRWTSGGRLSARLANGSAVRATGRRDGARLELAYPVGGPEYPTRAVLSGVRSGAPDEP